MQKIVNWAGNIGSLAAILCAIHCLAMPFVMVLLPSALAGAVRSEGLEWTMWGITAVLGGWSLWKSKRTHFNPFPLYLFGIGVILLFVNLLIHTHPPMPPFWLQGVGLAMILIAQFYNFRLSHFLAHANGECKHA